MYVFYFWRYCLKHLFLGFTTIFLLITGACNLGFTQYDTYYYIQQSQDTETEDTAPSEDIDLQLNYMFDILQPMGAINEIELEALLLYYQDELLADENLLNTFYYQIYELPVVKSAADSSFEVVDFLDFNFNEALIEATFSSKNVPSMKYSFGELWSLSDDTTYLPPLNNGEKTYTYEYAGENTKAGVNAITNVTYIKYEGFNPFFAIDSKYNQAMLADESERGMERFLFYRFKGKGGGIVDLDNMLVAVDTYTSLIFGFAVPTEFISLLGQDNPTKWEPVESAASAPDGQKYKFYEYDPAGYVDATGTFVMYDWYINNLSQANAANKEKFYPQFTGVSPYLVNFDVKKPTFAIRNNLGDNSNGYFTELSDFTFDQPPGVVETYDIYRIDDSSTARRLIATINAGDTDAIFKDENALILTKYPQYSIEAKDKNGNIIGSPSDLQEGKRDLTNREITLSIIESLRYALIDQGAHGSITGSKIVTSENGGTFTYKKSGLFTGTYTYTLIDFKPHLFTLKTAENAAISYQAKNVLTSIQTSTPFTGTINISGDYSGTIVFNNIEISNNDKESPAWTAGSLDLTVNGRKIQYQESGENTVPFGFYMTKDTFVQSLLDENGQYIQQ